jgi:hypothetical protein
MLAVADDRIRATRAAAGAAEASEACSKEARVERFERQQAYFEKRMVGLPRLATAIERQAAGRGVTYDVHVVFLLDEAPDLIEDLLRRAKLSTCAPRAAVREGEARVTGSRGECLLGGTKQARVAVLGSELEQAERKLKRLRADEAKQVALVHDLREKRDAALAFARHVSGEEEASEGGQASKRPRVGRT